MYLLQSYFCSWFEDALAGNRYTTLFMSKKQLWNFWYGFTTDTGLDNIIKNPIDQSKFDHHQDFAIISIIIDCMVDFVLKYAPVKNQGDLIYCLHKVKDIILNKSYIEYSDAAGVIRRKKIISGLASGWRTTTLWGTIANMAEMHCAKQFLSRIGFSGSGFGECYQGDDVRLLSNSVGWCIGLVEIYNLMGFSVNPQKTFLATDRDEFLRLVSEDGKYTSGYPIRLCLNILWRKPVSRDPPAGIYRIAEMRDLWHKMSLRCSNFDSIVRHMFSDISNANGVSKQDLLSIFCTPSCVGGMALFVDNQLEWKIIEPGKIKHLFDIDLSQIVGLDYEFNLFVDKLGIPHEWLTYIKRKVVENLDFADSHIRISRGKIRVVSKIEKLSYILSPTHYGPPVKARFIDGLPHSMLTLVVEAAIRYKRWDIIELMLDAKSKIYYNRISSRGGRRVAIHWLLGKLPFKIPLILGFGVLQIKSLYDLYVNAYWGYVVSLRHFSYSTVLSAAYSAELLTRANIRNMDIVFGG
jgi:hypothetical protein